ncbi:MAG TPA: hypothetical protein VGX92_00560 [Pyrinomonadaceae bacterium]|jgi:hypothetical protein|nr:hypothetical protein [Pyrinomonadaceae bacterium]
MRKLLVAALIIGATFGLGIAQENTEPQQPQQQQDTEQMLKMGHAPNGPGGIGRAVVVVTDEQGAPVKGAYVKLVSVWGDGNLCESWAWTNDQGVVVLPPLHMDDLKMNTTARGYKKSVQEIELSALSNPIRITLTSKK